MVPAAALVVAALAVVASLVVTTIVFVIGAAAVALASGAAAGALVSGAAAGALVSDAAAVAASLSATRVAPDLLEEMMALVGHSGLLVEVAAANALPPALAAVPLWDMADCWVASVPISASMSSFIFIRFVFFRPVWIKNGSDVLGFSSFIVDQKI